MDKEDYISWLNEGRPKRPSKFINQRLAIGKSIIGIYSGRRKATNTFGRTYHYIIANKEGEFIFDSNNPKIAERFMYIRIESRVQIKKIAVKGGHRFIVTEVNSLEDEAYGL